jgi:hypothetical protein
MYLWISDRRSGLYIYCNGLVNAFPGNSSVNTVQHATIEEAVFSVDPTDAPIDWIAITWYVFTVGPCPFHCYIEWQNLFRAVTSQL